MGTQPSLRRSCVFCRARKIRCSGGHICTACRERNIDCVYSPEARKGRPKRKATCSLADPRDAEQPSSVSPRSAVENDAEQPPTEMDRTIGDDLEHMFNAYFIEKTASNSNMFQDSIASFLRRTPRPPPRPPVQRPDYDRLLTSIAQEMIERLLLRLGHLGYQQPDPASRNLYISNLSIDTTASMFDTPQRQNPRSAWGAHRVLQLVDLWFLMHPLSSIISKTLLISRIKDETMDEALLAVILADACEMHRSANEPDEAGPESQILSQFAATQIKSRSLSLLNEAPLSTTQTLMLMAWRNLCMGHARRATSLVGYTCRTASRVRERWMKNPPSEDIKLNGVEVASVEKESLRHLYWVCLCTTTWAFMQIDQPFSLLVPEEIPEFPCLDHTTSAILRLDRASDNISTLPAQVQSMGYLWPLSHVASTVAHVYTLHLNSTEDQKDQDSWQTRHIHQFQHLLQARAGLSTLVLDIRGILLPAIQAVEQEVSNVSSRSFLLIAYHTIVIHLLFSKAGQISLAAIQAFCQSASALISICRRFFPSPTSTMPSFRGGYRSRANMLCLGLDTCSRALVYIYNQSVRVSIQPMRDQLAKYADQLHQICKGDLASHSPAIRHVKKRLKQTKLAFQSPKYLTGSRQTFSFDQALSEKEDWSASSAPGPLLDSSVSLDRSPDTSMPDLSPSEPSLGLGPSPEVIDPCFFGDDPSGSLLGFPRLTNATINSYQSGGKDPSIDDLLGGYNLIDMNGSVGESSRPDMTSSRDAGSFPPELDFSASPWPGPFEMGRE